MKGCRCGTVTLYILNHSFLRLQIVELGQDNQRLKDAAEKASTCWFTLMSRQAFMSIQQVHDMLQQESSCMHQQYGVCPADMFSCVVQASTAAEEKVKQIQECNKQAMKENCRCVSDKCNCRICLATGSHN
jgi:hypothetical protein